MPPKGLFRLKCFIPGYNFVRADNPNNTKSGGVCIYYHIYLSMKVTGI